MFNVGSNSSKQIPHKINLTKPMKMDKCSQTVSDILLKWLFSSYCSVWLYSTLCKCQMCITNTTLPVGDKQMSSSPQQMGDLEFISLVLLSFIFLLSSLTLTASLTSVWLPEFPIKSFFLCISSPTFIVNLKRYIFILFNAKGLDS